MYRLSNIHPYLYYGVWRVDSCAKILPGRPHGGVAIFWNRCISHMVTIIKSKCKRVSAIKLKVSAIIVILVLCLYMPCDNYHAHTVDTEYNEVIDYCEQMLDGYNMW